MTEGSPEQSYIIGIDSSFYCSISVATTIPNLESSTTFPSASPEWSGRRRDDYPGNVATKASHKFFSKRSDTSATAGLLQPSLPNIAAGLWNPVNSTPRAKSKPPPKTKPRPQPLLLSHPRDRRPSTPPPPAIALEHPSLDPGSFGETSGIGDPTGAGEYPLLSLVQQRQLRSPATDRATSQIDKRNSADTRASLPRSVRLSIDSKRSLAPTPTPSRPEFGLGISDLPEERPTAPGGSYPSTNKGRKQGTMAATAKTMPSENDNNLSDQAAAFAADLERGLDDHGAPRLSADSIDGIGSAISSSNSSIMGEELDPDADEWGPLHACYPHLNAHVPTESPEYATTRIIRIRRDWLLEGDLAPTFSNVYPEILDPAGISEVEFRQIIEKLNSELVPAFNPYALRNVLDSVLGLATGWLWDDFGLTAVKSRLNALEAWIERWNARAAERVKSSEEGAIPPKIISLRQTGYMTLDIQVRDPEIAPVPSSSHSAGEPSPAFLRESGPVMISA